MGEAFGTRKAKSRIKADERNKVDAGRQEDGREGLMELIEEKGKGMPTVGKFGEPRKILKQAAQMPLATRVFKIYKHTRSLALFHASTLI